MPAGHRKHKSLAWRKMMSEKYKGRKVPWLLGKHHSEETKRKIGRKGDKHWMFGKKTPQSIREKISASIKKTLSNGDFRYHPTGEKHCCYIDGRSETREYKRWLHNLRDKRIKDAGGSHTYGEWTSLKSQYNFTCPCCGKSEPEIFLTQDHIVPVCKGGSNNIENIQPLCLPCNMHKHTKIEYYAPIVR